MIEHERSFIFTWPGIVKFLQSMYLKLDAPDCQITDYYLDANTRVRQITAATTKYHLTEKKGNKADGQRVETEVEIDVSVADILKSKAQLTVLKTRHKIDTSVLGDFNPLRNCYRVVVDFIEHPLQLAVMEIECDTEVRPDIAEYMFGIHLKECPLSAWRLLKRKIGICGGPSSGKTETAKSLSHLINSDWRGNSFHVYEFATSFIQKYKRNPQFTDQFFIWHGQSQREKDAAKADIVISDCPTFLSYIYTLVLNKTDLNPESALYFAKLYKRVLFELQDYTDLLFLPLRDCRDYHENHIRFQNPNEAIRISQRIQTFLDEHKVPYKVVDYAQVPKILNDLFYVNENFGE